MTTVSKFSKPFRERLAWSFVKGIAMLLLAALPARLPAQVKCGLSPALIMADFKPGVPFEVTLEISNGSSAPMAMHGEAMDYWYDHENKKVFAAPGTMPHSAASWIEFVPRSIVVPALGSSKVKMMVTPPANADGSFYAVAFLESKPELTEPAQGDRHAVFTNIRLGALVLLSAENSQKYSISVSGLKLDPPSSNRQLEASFMLENTSNTHIFPESSLIVMDSRRNVLGKAQGDTKRFLPGQADHLSIKWSGTLAPGAYTALVSLLYGKTETFIKEVPFTVTESSDLVADGPRPSTSSNEVSAVQHP